MIKILQVTINEASKHKHIFSGFLYFYFSQTRFDITIFQQITKRRITAVYMIRQRIRRK
nr:MAG TPA: hypothetical protein [Caudoviricetes sp.]